MIGRDAVQISEYIYEDDISEYRKIGFDDNHEILTKYCACCKNKPNCDDHEALKHVDIKRNPYKSPFFVPVYVFNTNEKPSPFSEFQNHVYCGAFINTQRRFFEYEYYDDGLERLIELSNDFFKIEE